MSCADFVVQVNLVHGEEQHLSALGDPFHVCWPEVLANAEQALEKFESLASAALPGSAVQRLVYQDDEGDWCTLNKHSLTDAQGFMAISEDGSCMTLRIKVVANSAGSMGKREMTQVPLADAERAAEDSSAPSAAAAEAVTEAGDLLQAVNQIARGLDMRRLLPRLASAGLRVVEGAAEPALFPLILPLEAFREGELSADSLPVALPQFAQALADLPPGSVPGVVELCKKEAAQAVEDLKREVGEGIEVEVHRNVICDGCEVTPIMGKRYQSLTKDDYDLCESCFSKTNEDKNSFKRVKSDVVAQVVSSFYGPRGSPGPGGGPVHHSVQCDGCGEFPLAGTRFRSLDRPDYDLCGRCHGELQASGREAGRLFQEIAPPGHRPPSREGGEMDIVVEGAGLAAFAAAEVKATAEPGHGKGKHKGMCKGKGKGKHKGKHHDRPPPPPTAPATRPTRDEAEESWKLFFDENCGGYYYHNRMTRETTWVMPETLRQTSSAQLAQQASAGSAPDEPCEEAKLEIEERLRALDGDALRGVLAGLLAHPDRSVRDAVEAAASSYRGLQGSRGEAQDDDNMETSHEACSVHSWEMPDAEPGPPEPFELPWPSTEPESGLPPASARVLGSVPLTLGVEATEVHASRGDATEELAAGAAQAYRIGCVVLPAGLGSAVPVCAKVTVVNDGQVPWPEMAAVALVAGEALDFQHLPLGPLEPGEVAEVVMDLLVPPKPAPCAQRSSWAIIDASSGALLGPVLVLEVQWGGA